MTEQEHDGIRIGQIIEAQKEGCKHTISYVVQILPGDGRVILSTMRSRRKTLITTQDAILNGEEVVDGKMGRLRFMNQSEDPLVKKEDTDIKLVTNPSMLVRAF